MGNILIDMMGLLSRKRVVKKYEDTDFIVLGRRPNPDDSMFNTPKMYNELISMKDLRSAFDVGEVTGSGTTGFLPVYTDGANSVIGDSQLRQGQLGNGLYQMRMENTDRFIINKPSSVVAGDPEYLVQQDGQYKVSFGWDDDGDGYGFMYNYSGAGLKLGAAGNNPMIEIKTTSGSEEIDLHKSIKFVDYGSGSKTGTATYNLSVDASGNVIETASGGGIGGTGTIDTLPIFTAAATLGDSLVVSTSGGNGIGINMTAGAGSTATFRVESTGAGGTPDVMQLSSASASCNIMLDQSGGTPFGYYGNACVVGGAATEMQLRSNTDLLFSSGGGTEHMRLKSAGDLQLPLYGSGTFTGTATFNLSVDASGNIIETTAGGGSGISQTTGTITPSVSAGISGINYNHQYGYWTRTGNMVDVYLSISIGTFTKTDLTQALVLKDAFPYDIHSQRQFFNGDILSYVNISDSGTAIPALYIANPNIVGAAAYDIQFIRSANYSLTTSNTITTNEMSTGSFAVELSFRYRCTDSTTLRSGASIDS